MTRPAAASRALFGVAIAAALAFGASQLGASPRAATCPYNPASGEVGACSTQTDCSNTCLYYFPENGGTGFCRQGCCLCAT